MRILHWYPNFLTGGAVANALLGLVNAQAHGGAEVFIASAEISGNPLYGSVEDHLRPEVKLIRWNPSWTFRQRGFVLRGVPSDIRKQLVRLKPDVVHIHGEFNPDNLRVPTLFQCPIHLSPHGAFHPLVLRKGSQLKSFYMALAKYLLYKKVVFHALTPMEEIHITRVLPKAKVYCVPQGSSVQMEKHLADRDHCRPSSNGIRFLYVGRLDVHTKGLDILLEAFSKAVHRLQGQETSLVLVGPDWNKGSVILANQANALGISKCVTTMGTRIGSDLVKVFTQSHIYIHVSRYEGHPLAVTEALLFGKPAILSNTIGTISYPEVSSLPQLIIVPPKVNSIADAMISAIKCLEDLQKSAKKAELRVQQFFSWDRVAALHLRAYEHLSSC